MTESLEDLRGFKTIEEQLVRLRKLAANPLQRVKTGLPSLDMLVLGPARGEVFTFVARSGVGKSLVATNIMFNNQSAGLIFFSLEMPDHQVLQRLFSHTANFSGREVTEQIARGHVPDTIDVLTDRYRRHVIEDADGLTLDDMSVKIEMYDEYYRQRPDAVIIDYLEEIGGGKASGDGWTRTEATASALKSWSKREQMAVYSLHQANMKTEPWEPITRSSAKGGGYTESDVVMGMWRPGWDPNLPDIERMRLEDDIYINVVKNRVNGRHTVPDRDLKFRITDSMRMVELEHEINRRFYGKRTT